MLHTMINIFLNSMSEKCRPSRASVLMPYDITKISARGFQQRFYKSQ